jgi:autotransporter-associated beta strand protein
MSIRMSRITFLTAAALLFLAAQRLSVAGSATWSNKPSSGDWNNPANWIPNTVPNGTSDVATFAASRVTEVTNSNVIVNLDSLVFNPGTPQYTISALDNIELYGTGIANNSGTTQFFVAGAFFFNNSAAAGNMTNFSNVGGLIVFYDSSSAGSATINLSDNMYQASLEFWESSTAANATISATGGAEVSLFDNATGGNATFTISGESFLGIVENATADHASATCIGGDQYYGAAIFFQGFGSAGESTFTAVGASTSGEKGAYIEFDGSATAANGTFVIGGGLSAGLAATTLTFFDTTTAAAATITASSGTGGSDGGAISFQEKSKGGTCSITLSGNADLDISTHRAPGVTIGSLAGAGSVLLGANTLTIGSNNQSTAFSGVIQNAGGLTKTGTGALTLSGTSTYTGGTTVSAGALKVNNNSGSGTGTGAVNVNASTLGGRGIIAGATTVGTGSGTGAFVAPAVGSTTQATLTIQSALTLNADATYAYTFRAKRNRATTDKVIANGVTINSGAMVALSGQTQGALTQGLVLTLISNISANPISGTFSNLPNGGIVTINGNHLQANYSGGDGNDLTLTVMP